MNPAFQFSYGKNLLKAVFICSSILCYSLSFDPGFALPRPNPNHCHCHSDCPNPRACFRPAHHWPSTNSASEAKSIGSKCTLDVDRKEGEKFSYYIKIHSLVYFSVTLSQIRSMQQYKKIFNLMYFQ